jgi:predicted ribosome quality control (RQC) complex YloA/Tae2 family protein
MQGLKSTWNYIDGCMIKAILEMYAITKEDKYLKFADDFIDCKVNADGTIEGYDVDELNIDNVNAGKTLFELFDLTGAKKLEALNYYTNEMITIPLDSQLDAKGNAQKYFDRYNKLKRTYEALTKLTEETKTEIEHLESISTALDIALTEDDLVQIKEELIEFGYIKRKKTDKKARIKSKPFHYRSSDGYDIYVGKNNYQNDELTFKFATGNDWWFHAKGMPGSHVIVKSNNEELPDRVFEEAGMLAGYYSKGREDEKVEIDYLQKKNVKKPNGAAPGFVVYYTNYSLTIHPDISGLTLVSD